MNKKLQLGRYDFAAYSAFMMYSVCSLAIPLMIVTIGQSLNFPMDGGGMAAGGVLHMTRSVAMLVTLLSCGWFSGFLGKRITMGMSMILIGIGISCCAFAPAYWVLIPCLLLSGLGEGICEGIATPFVQDLHPDSPERYVNIAHAFWSVGIALTVFVAVGLLTIGVSWRVILGIIGILTLLSSLFFTWKENPDKAYPESAVKQNMTVLLQNTVKIIKVPRFWLCCLIMFFGAGAEFGLTFWSAAYVELTFGTGKWVAGLGTGMIALGMFIGRAGFGYFAKLQYLRRILLCTAGMTIPLSVALALLKPGIMPQSLMFVTLFILLFLCGIGIAPYWPTTQVLGVKTMPQLDSTLLYIYFSAMGIPGGGFFAWLMGFAGDRWGLPGAIAVVPCCLVIFIILVIMLGSTRKHLIQE